MISEGQTNQHDSLDKVTQVKSCWFECCVSKCKTLTLITSTETTSAAPLPTAEPEGQTDQFRR